MKKLAALLLLCAPLGACGFQPMYGAGLSPQLASIYVEPVAERDGYELRNHLIDLLGTDGRTTGKHYRLTLSLTENSQGIALQNDAAITRYNDTLKVVYILTDLNGREITRGNQTSLSAYNVSPSPYSTLKGQQDADRRAALDVAERIRLDLGAFFRRSR